MYGFKRHLALKCYRATWTYSQEGEYWRERVYGRKQVMHTVYSWMNHDRSQFTYLNNQPI